MVRDGHPGCEHGEQEDCERRAHVRRARRMLQLAWSAMILRYAEGTLAGLPRQSLARNIPNVRSK